MNRLTGGGKASPSGGATGVGNGRRSSTALVDANSFISSSSSPPPPHYNSNSGNALLLRFVESSHFSIFHCVSYLEIYAHNLGIHFHLCNKMRSYPSNQIEFFLPQLVQLHVTVETESMALEDLLLDLCNESTHCTLLVFWQLQAHLTESSIDPESYGFQVCKRLYNKLQYLLFNVGSAPSHKLRENTGPAIVLGSLLAAGIAMPAGPEYIKPLIMSQGRKQRTHIFHIATKLLRSKSTSNVTIDGKEKAGDDHGNGSSTGKTFNRKASPNHLERSETTPAIRTVSNESGAHSIIRGMKRITTPTTPTTTPTVDNSHTIKKSHPSIEHLKDETVYKGKSNALSLPDLSSSDYRRNRSNSESSTPSSPILTSRRIPSNSSSHLRTASTLSRSEQIRSLKTNYFRCETQFVYALQSISTRLLQVPKQARQSALIIELALINNDLPAEVDIPLLLPTRTNGPNPTLNRIVRISPAEATVLNSAEKVPFLMLIEYLRDDIDFNPENEKNKHLLSEKTDRRYIFDLAYLHDQKKKQKEKERALNGSESDDDTETEGTNNNQYNQLNGNGLDDDDYPLEEKDVGDLSVVSLYEDRQVMVQDAVNASISSLPFLSTNNNNSDSSPRASDLSFSSSYVPPSNQPSPIDVTDLATHMRTAAIMLTQLDGANGSKLPRDEIASIKAKIIASMQSLEDYTVNSTAASVFKGEAGDRKLENDLKTSGITSDDPSAANLGEDWTLRKERIRKTSPYGHLPNWDLFSVIAKTGFDLRQEAFACQLIEAINKVWIDNKVPVWVKKMRILITSESTGLVETITNGLSIHSIKKALTNASQAAGTNPKNTIVTLSDHFEKTFGPRGSPNYNKALTCFAQSLAPYSILSYILQIKDRHNGNILLDNHGHIIHIDFGFLLSNSPGQFGFEAAPFKLTQEYVDLLGGVDSEYFQQFRTLLKQAFKVLRKQAESIIILVEMMSRDSNLPCFSSGAATSLQLRQRFQLHLSDNEMDQFVDNNLIQKSLGSIYTRLYDQFQLLTQGIYS